MRLGCAGHHIEVRSALISVGRSFFLERGPCLFITDARWAFGCVLGFSQPRNTRWRPHVSPSGCQQRRVSVSGAPGAPSTTPLANATRERPVLVRPLLGATRGRSTAGGNWRPTPGQPRAIPTRASGCGTGPCKMYVYPHCSCHRAAWTPPHHGTHTQHGATRAAEVWALTPPPLLN